MLPRDSKGVERRETSRFVARFDVQLRTEVPGEFRFASYCGKHSGEKEQVAPLQAALEA
jgi:hypothetical protein